MSAPVFVLSMPIGSWHPVLPAAVASLLAQDQPLRVAVLNASGDPRVDAALAPLEPLIAHRHDGPDDGQAAAIQEGWNRVEGDFYGWLNADDFLYPDALSKAARLIADEDAVDVVTAHTSLFNEDMAFLGAHPAVEPPGPALLRGNTISQPSTFVRADALQGVGGLNTGLHYTMDWDLWARLLAGNARFRLLDDVLSGVVVAETTKTSQFNRQRAGELYAIARRYGGHYRALKSLFGYLQYHWAEKSRPSSGNSRVRTPPSAPGTLPFLVSGRSFREPVRAVLARFDMPVKGLVLEGQGEVRLRAGQAADCTAIPGQPAAIGAQPGETLDLVIEPSGAEARIDRIQLL